MILAKELLERHYRDLEPRTAAESSTQSYSGYRMGKDGIDAHRVSVTFTRAQHLELELIAKKHGMKVAWVVRRAAERLIEHENGGPMLPLDIGGLDALR